MSLLFSTTIKDKNIPEYQQMRKDLRSRGMSIGEYLIQSYRKETNISPLDTSQK
jgi:hypothetical protein